jgi:vanillate O-demethylase monooxygenase subunit
VYPLKDGDFAPLNQWYIAAWSSEVSREPMERWILDQPVAFYRKENGDPVAVQGRCPHRHFPLGKSRVSGDDIECLYHGLTFSPEGHCVRIPAQNMIPARCKIDVFPVVERWKWLWIWMGDPVLADPGLIPDHLELGLTDPEYQVDPGAYFEVPGRYMLMHDNLFDLTHLGFLHAESIGAGDFSKVEEKREYTDTWISSAREFRDIDPPPLFAQIFDHPDRMDRDFGMKLHLPCLHAGYDHFYRKSDDETRADNLLGKLSVYHAITPATKTTAHYFFASGRTFMRDDAEFGAQMLEGLKVVIGEDLIATREIEQMIGQLGDRLPEELLLASDATCARGRKLFEDLIAAERN